MSFFILELQECCIYVDDSMSYMNVVFMLLGLKQDKLNMYINVCVKMNNTV